jgi:hypothetical protein
VTKRDDFADLKESQVIQACRAADIIDKHVLNILNEALNRRNMAAHPSDVDIEQIDAEQTVKSLVKNVVYKYKLR